MRLQTVPIVWLSLLALDSQYRNHLHELVFRYNNCHSLQVNRVNSQACRIVKSDGRLTHTTVSCKQGFSSLVAP
ncbi:hypothetical protein SK128_024361 [Halocaridina rubra]|uniref:Uncharacterized protein n=1 Tax=Halocaridina rubra TaxID=373956 RepID=A0AAN9A8W2_HALRR